jgi:hypothetical protein
MPKPSSLDLLPIDLNSKHASVRHRHPLGRVLVVERPGWHDDEEGKEGASEADVDAVVHVLGVVAGSEGEHLPNQLGQEHGAAVLGSEVLTPTMVRSAV